MLIAEKLDPPDKPPRRAGRACDHANLNLHRSLPGRLRTLTVVAAAFVTFATAAAHAQDPAEDADMVAQAPPGWPDDGRSAASRPSESIATQPEGSPLGATDNPGYDPGGGGRYPNGYDDGTLIPPNVEVAPTASDGGGFCYVGPHPVDTRVVPGTSWDETQGQHLRPYAPIDTRLFSLRDGCYHFTGDPRDFGYEGQTYSYYGAHPVLDSYGGGWCFMMGGHAHVWAPWSPHFTVVGPWYYWQGGYDPFFWAYWPYYSFYYRSYYPHYYGGGRFYRGGGYHVAPPIRHVPPTTWRGGHPGRVAPVVRGMPPAQMYRQSPGVAPGSRGWSPNNGPANAPAPSSAGQPYFGPRPAPSFSPGARPSFTPRGGSPMPHGGGIGGGSFRGGGRR